MYERMLNKQQEPSVAEMTSYCGQAAELFTALNNWLSQTCGTIQERTFPYGNRYGWGIAHRIRKKLICNIFAEKDALTVMMRLTNLQFASQYSNVQKYTREYIEHKYPCGGGGWIQYRVTCQEHLDDIEKLLAVKCGSSFSGGTM